MQLTRYQYEWTSLEKGRIMSDSWATPIQKDMKMPPRFVENLARDFGPLRPPLQTMEANVLNLMAHFCRNK